MPVNSHNAEYQEALTAAVDRTLHCLRYGTSELPLNEVVEAKTGRTAYDARAVDERHEWDMEWERQIVVVLLRAAERQALSLMP